VTTDAARVLCATAFIGCCAVEAGAQTAPLPAVARGDDTGFLTRGAFSASLAGIETADPRFSTVERSRADVDLGAYPAGRINVFFDAELVMGSERRRFDLDQGNIIVETSASYRIGSLELTGVVHHESRHVVDRPSDRVVAWHTIGARVTQTYTLGPSALAVTLDYGHVMQSTFVDYRWTSQLTLRYDRPIANAAHLFATGSGGLIGVDELIANRDTQVGARFEAGVRLPGAHAALDLFSAYERRIDGYPTSRQPLSWFEIGFRLGTP
jgi:hypothetical protein